MSCRIQRIPESLRNLKNDMVSKVVKLVYVGPLKSDSTGFGDSECLLDGRLLANFENRINSLFFSYRLIVALALGSILLYLCIPYLFATS